MALEMSERTFKVKTDELELPWDLAKRMGSPPMKSSVRE